MSWPGAAPVEISKQGPRLASPISRRGGRTVASRLCGAFPRMQLDRVVRSASADRLVRLPCHQPNGFWIL